MSKQRFMQPILKTKKHLTSQGRERMACLFHIRDFRESDIHQIIKLFYDTVHSVNGQDYSQKELKAWAPIKETGNFLERWKQSLGHNITYVATSDSRIIGFCDMSHSGHLDRLYVHKDHQGKGIATALVNKIEGDAKNANIKEIHTDASITAKPFFEKRGYQVVKPQNVKRYGVTLKNYRMKKVL